jgi:hypothetical protein
MRTLKLISEGLVLHEDFEDSVLDELLTNNSDLVINNSSAELKHGSIYMGTSSFDSLVFVVTNDFNPSLDSDVGGIRLAKDKDYRDLYEYYDPNNNMGALPYVKVVKDGDVFKGYGSNDEITWVDKGSIIFANTDSIGIGVESTTLYKAQELRVYKSESITVRTLLAGWKVEVYKTGNLVDSKVSTGDSVQLNLLTYPFTGTFKVYDESDTLITDELLTDVWGGDDYSCSLNIDVLDNNGNNCYLNIAKHLGNMTQGKIEKKFSIRNNNNTPLDVVMSIATYSPFGDWVTLSKDDNGVPLEYLDEISISLAANETKPFWIFVTNRTSMTSDYEHDYRNTECLFYLLVE